MISLFTKPWAFVGGVMLGAQITALLVGDFPQPANVIAALFCICVSASSDEVSAVC